MLLRRTTPTLAIPLALALAACGIAGTPTRAPDAGSPPAVTSAAGPSGPTAATPVRACDLVTQQEAEALAGTPLDPPTDQQQTCTLTAPVDGPVGQVQIFVGDGAKKYLDVERTLGHELRALPGVGDECYLGDAAFFVRKGFTWVTVSLVRLNDPAENAAALQQLARAVATRF